MFTQKEVDANPTLFSYNMKTGYKLLGAPRLPSSPVGPASACEPSFPADNESWHFIIPPNQPDTAKVRAQWIPKLKAWKPPLEAQGRRVAFSSQYLAAHGWIYGEAE